MFTMPQGDGTLPLETVRLAKAFVVHPYTRALTHLYCPYSYLPTHTPTHAHTHTHTHNRPHTHTHTHTHTPQYMESPVLADKIRHCMDELR